MKRAPVFAVLVAFLVTVTASSEDKQPENKLPDDVVKTLEKAKELTIYSLDGLTDAKDNWHGATVLGQATVKGDDVKKLVADIRKGVEEGARGSRCFIPRHGIRGTHDNVTFDLVICYECGWIYVYSGNSTKPQVFLITDSTQTKLNKILTDAKVPLAKPPAPAKK